jgi:hypothetical protein
MMTGKTLFSGVALTVLAVITGINLALLVTTHRPGAETTSTNSRVAIEIVPTEMSGFADDRHFVVARSAENVSLNYDVRNISSEPLQNIRPVVSCSCSLVEPFPPTLNPDESYTMRLKVRAPRAGVREQLIPFVAGTPATEIGFLKLTIQVPWDPPALSEKLIPFHTIFVEGTGPKRELLVKTIESARSNPWIESASIVPPDIATVIELDIDERVVSPDYVARAYTFTLQIQLGSEGCHPNRMSRAQLNFRTSEEIDRRLEPLPVSVEFMPSVVAVPRELRFSAGNAPRVHRLHLISRSGERTFRLTHGDRSRFSITSVPQASNQWEISLVQANAAEITDHLVFEDASGYVVAVPVYAAP